VILPLEITLKIVLKKKDLFLERITRCILMLNGTEQKSLFKKGEAIENYCNT